MTALDAAACEQIRLQLEASEGAQRLETVEHVLRAVTEVTGRMATPAET